MHCRKMVVGSGKMHNKDISGNLSNKRDLVQQRNQQKYAPGMEKMTVLSWCTKEVFQKVTSR